MTEGPFGPAADIGVGFSDVALLVASVTGFCCLAVGVYAIVLVRLKSRADMQKSEGEDGYDEQLANADAATLNRAQRRARARATMKMQRRIAPIVPGQRDNIQAIGAVGEEGEGESIRHLSRKERQKAAKLVEKDERRLFEEERRKQHLELQDATKRLKEEKEILDERRRDEEKIAKNAVEEEQRNRIEDEWLTFLTCSERKETVNEWVREIKASRSVALDIIAKDFGVSQTVVKNRIQELIEERRVAGIISNDGRFIHLSDNELHKIAARLRKLGSFSMKDIAAMRKAVASE